MPKWLLYLVYLKAAAVFFGAVGAGIRQWFKPTSAQKPEKPLTPTKP